MRKEAGVSRDLAQEVEGECAAARLPGRVSHHTDPKRLEFLASRKTGRWRVRLPVTHSTECQHVQFAFITGDLATRVKGMATDP